MKTLQEYLMEAIANGRFKVSSVVNKIIKKPVVDSICKDITTKLEAFGFKDFSIEPNKSRKELEQYRIQDFHSTVMKYSNILSAHVFLSTKNANLSI